MVYRLWSIVYGLLSKQKLPSTKWDGRGVSRGTTQISHMIVTHFVLTIISLPGNAGIAA